jgi:hypothetical protein
MTHKIDKKQRNSKAWNVIEKALLKLKSDGRIEVHAPLDTITEFLTREIIESGLMREFILLDKPVPTHLVNDLEAVVTEGGFTRYVSKIEFNPSEGKLQLQFQQNPERDGRIVQVLTFKDVQNFTESVDELDGDSLDDNLEVLIGLDEYVSKYVIRTDCRELIFNSDKPPELEILFLSRRQSPES